MIKKITLFSFCIIVSILMIACTNKYETKSAKNLTSNDVIAYNWILSKDKNNPVKIKKILDIIGNVDFKRLNDLAKKNNKESQFHKAFYKPFYDYNDHNNISIENIFKARERALDKNEFDDLLFDLYKKDSVKSTIDNVITLNPTYKSLFNDILKSENEAYLVYDWGTTSKRDNSEETKKILDVIANVDFTKVSCIEQRNNNYISYSFYNYPYHNFDTIKNMFNAKTDGPTAEQFDSIIYLLYKRNNIKPTIDQVVNSNPKYKKRFNIIERKYDNRNYFNIILNCFFIVIGIFAILVKIKSNKYLLSSRLKDKIIIDQDKFIKYQKIKLKASGIIIISMGITGFVISSLKNFNIIVYFLGFAVLIININYFEYKSDKFIKDKNI